MRYLVDTDWIIDGIANLSAARDLLHRLSTDGLAVSVISLGELFEGAYLYPAPEDHIRTYRQFLAGYSILPVTEDIVSRFATIRALLRRQGKLIPDLDLLIAVTALEHNLTLLTHNVRHFDRVPNLQVYLRHL
jgi:predicted nucleic acid-binding protein